MAHERIGGSGNYNETHSEKGIPTQHAEDSMHHGVAGSQLIVDTADDGKPLPVDALESTNGETTPADIESVADSGQAGAKQAAAMAHVPAPDISQAVAQDPPEIRSIEQQLADKKAIDKKAIDKKAIELLEKQFLEQESSEKQAIDKVMSEGQQVLSRLKDAKQQLIVTDGKDLPAVEGAPLVEGVLSSGPLSEQLTEQTDHPLSADGLNHPERILSGGLGQAIKADGKGTDGQHIDLAQLEGEGADNAIQDGTEIQSRLVSDGEKNTKDVIQGDSKALSPLARQSHSPAPAFLNSIAGHPHQKNDADVNGATSMQTSSPNLAAPQSFTAANASSETAQLLRSQFSDVQGGKSFETVKGSKEKQMLGQAREKHIADLAAAHGLQGAERTVNITRPETIHHASQVYLTKDHAAEQLAERVNMMMSKNLKNIDIRLDPPELGKMHIRMNMTGDATTVHFTVANHHARDALEASMPRLREMMAQQGVQLGETSVQHQGSHSSQQEYAASGQGAGSQAMQSAEHALSEDNSDTGVKLDLQVGQKHDGISYYA
jgi:flagellar hook-length control protein FliK